MAIEKSRFFDSVGDDRVYQADQFAEYFRLFLSDGIRNGGLNLQVTANGNSLAVRVGYGTAMIQGYGYWLDDDGSGAKVLDMEAANTLTRIDRIVLRLDRSLSKRNIELKIKKGTPAANPVPLTLTRNDNIHELSLARVQVRANTLAIASADITDERLDQSVCGLVNSLISLDTAQLQARADAFFEAVINAGYLRLEGGKMLGNIDLNNKNINNLPNPTAARQPVTLEFADGRYPKLENLAPLLGNIPAVTKDTDLNTITSAGVYMVSGTTHANKPSNYGILLVFGTQYNSFIAQQFISGYGGLWIRFYANSAWGTWFAPNASNADTVDGKHDTDFATAAQGIKSDNALPKTGGTITGQVVIYGNAGDQRLITRSITGSNALSTPGPLFINPLNPEDPIYVGSSSVNKVWHGGNDGAGSGLDADLLDGKHASELALVTHAHTQADITGLASALSGKAATSHTHTSANISDLWPVLYGATVPSTLQPGQIFVKI